MGMNGNYLSRQLRAMEARLKVNQELYAFSQVRVEYFKELADTIQSEGKETETTAYYN